MGFTYIIAQGIKTSPSVDGIGFTKDIKHSSFGPGQRKRYTIHYVINGKGYFNGNIVKQGQGFLVYDGMHAEHYADKNDPWELMWITLSGNCIEEIFKHYNADPVTKIFNYSSHNLVCEIANKIVTYKNINLDSLVLLEMFLYLHCNCIKNSNSLYSKPAPQIYIESALKYINDNIYRAVSVNELTKLIGVSQPYLFKLFKKQFNMSPKQYIMQLKVNAAKNMLINTNMTITEIANSIGYEDVLTFSRMFSLKENISPQNYRNRTYKN